ARPAETQRDARAEQPQGRPGGLARERLAQRFVGALRFEEAAVSGEELAELAPRLRGGRCELHQDLQLARRLVDAAEVLERARPRPPGVAPSGARRAQPRGNVQGAAIVAAAERILRPRQLRALRVCDRRLRPVLAGARSLDRGNAVAQLSEAPRLD